jgi:hypothetical protein
MAKYSAQFNRAASAAAAVGTITADATTPRRQKIYDLLVGSEAVPADFAFLWTLDRCTTAGTSTAVTPTKLDPGDAVALADAGENHTAEPTFTAGEVLLSIPLNQRATIRWVAPPGGELVIPAVASNGIGIRTPVAGAAAAITATAHFEEQ